jgi:carbonic anhydrase
MDSRLNLQVPDNFAFIIRTGGGNLLQHEFIVSFAISIAKIKHIALIGHDNCGMVNLRNRRKEFIEGLVEIAGWNRKAAKKHFDNQAPVHEIGNEEAFVLSQQKRLQARYPGICIAPIMYRLEDNRLCLLGEN